MKYLCLVYCEESLLHSLPDCPTDAECMAYAESFQGCGRMLASEALKPVQTATTVRVRGGHMSLIDGPFAETKEQLAGFYLVDARDLNEALSIAKGIPAARVGSVEVRPIRELHP
mgnify:CR=1 FL=1